MHVGICVSWCVLCLSILCWWIFDIWVFPSWSRINPGYFWWSFWILKIHLMKFEHFKDVSPYTDALVLSLNKEMKKKNHVYKILHFTAISHKYPCMTGYWHMIRHIFQFHNATATKFGTHVAKYIIYIMLFSNFEKHSKRKVIP